MSETHGATRYAKGCRCDVCRVDHAASVQRWRMGRKREKKPSVLTMPITPEQQDLIDGHMWCAEAGAASFRRIYNRRYGYDVLLSAATIGLIHAAKKYDPTRGTRFRSYAFFWIRRYLLRVRVDDLRSAGWVYCDGGKRLRRSVDVVSFSEAMS